MAYLNYGTVIKKNDIIISEDSWTEQELKINNNFFWNLENVLLNLNIME